MFSISIFSLMALLSSLADGQGNGQYTPWTPSTTEYWAPTTTTTDYWYTTTTSDYWTAETTPYAAWTSYTTVTSCYTQNGVIVTVTVWVPCPCEDGPSTIEPITTEPDAAGTTTETLITTTTPAYSTFTSNSIVYVVPISTPITTTASAGAEIVSVSDASKSTEIGEWAGIWCAFVLGGVAIVAIVL